MLKSEEIVKIAKEQGVKVLVDEAHGTHFYFGDNLPVSAMTAGATWLQSACTNRWLFDTKLAFVVWAGCGCKLCKAGLNLTQTQSGSYLLMMSLDVARRNLALRGRK